ncbi:hypothetical protein Tco_1422566, partial [Tanacetum coccineum]
MVKTGKHGHEERKSTKEVRKSSQSQNGQSFSQLWVKFQSEWSSFETLLWRGHTNRGCPGSPDVPHGPINSGDGSSIATLNKRFMGGTSCLSVVDSPDCEDSRGRSIHKSFTSSASLWES